MSESVQFSSDSPLTRLDEDRLERKKFCADLANALAGWKGKESLVVSLCGEWGSGKTTIKNFVVEELEKKTPKPIVGKYNPWQWTGQDKLLTGLLDELARLLGKPEITDQNEKLLLKFKVWAAAMEVGKGLIKAARPIFGPFWLLAGTNLAGLLLLWGVRPQIVATLSFFATVIVALLAAVPAINETVMKFLDALQSSRHKTIEELRLEVAKEMLTLDRTIIMFIDDIDRLNNDEVKQLIQLVKANVHFPNLIYCLLYQKDIVAAALKTIISDDGDRYLQKIVQVQFDVPRPSKILLQRIFAVDLEKILNQSGIEIVQDLERWNQLFPAPLWGYFKNVRDIKRFLGAFEFYFNMHLNDRVLEVNPIDLIAAETLRMFDHPAYMRMGASFFHAGIQSFNLFDEEQVAKDFSAQIKLIVDDGDRTAEKKDLLESTLKFLFPQAQSHGRFGNEHDWLLGLRICHPSHFDKYFQTTLDGGQLSARDLSNLVENSGDRTKVVELLSDALAKTNPSDFLEFVMAARDRIPTASLTAFLTALFDIGDTFPPGLGLLGTDVQMQLMRIIHHRLKVEPMQTRIEVLRAALAATTGVGLPIRVVGSEERRAERQQENEEFLVPEADMQRFRGLALEKILNTVTNGKVLESEYTAAILHRWKDWTDGTEVRAWVANAIQTPGNARKLLARLLTKSYVGTRMEPILHSSAIEAFLPVEELLAAIDREQGASPSEFESTGIRMLREAVTSKRAGRPYAEISRR